MTRPKVLVELRSSRLIREIKEPFTLTSIHSGYETLSLEELLELKKNIESCIDQYNKPPVAGF